MNLVNDESAKFPLIIQVLEALHDVLPSKLFRSGEDNLKSTLSNLVNTRLLRILDGVVYLR